MSDQSFEDPRAEIYKHTQGAFDLLEVEPERSLVMWKEGLLLAEKLQDPCLILHCKCWICNTLIFYLWRYAEALEIAVHAAVEARKPEYEGCDRIHLYRVLLDAYLYNDPVGYETDILSTIKYLQTAGESTANHPYDLLELLQWARTYVELALDHPDLARTEGLRYLQMCKSNFRLADAYSILCEIEFWRGDTAALSNYAKLGETHARKSISSTRRWLVEFLAWQAYAARKAGDTTLAAQAYRLLLHENSRLGAIPFPVYFDAICAYHELEGELEEALRIRDRQLVSALASGSPYIEAECRLRRCRLLIKLQHPFGEELQAAQQTATRLRRPDAYLVKLQTLHP